jgi:nucleoside-diphosphate-sugar epimerase
MVPSPRLWEAADAQSGDVAAATARQPITTSAGSKDQSMRILVTGGAGYVGSILVPVLLADNHHVTVLDRFDDGGTQLVANCDNPGFEAVRGDVRDERLLNELVPRADCIVPLAALVGAPLCQQDPTSATTVNRDAIVKLVDRLSSEQMIVYPTTNSGYGVGEQGQFCTEETELRPISLYGCTKVDAEKAVLESANGVSLRLATVFGLSPRMRLDLLVNDFTWRAVTDRVVVLFEAHFKRNFIHVRDVAATFQHVIANYESMRGEAFNVGLSSANLSKLELCEKIQAVVPKFLFMEAPIGEDPDKRNYIVSNAKLERTGWTAQRSIEDGVRELVKGYRMLRNSRYSNV